MSNLYRTGARSVSRTVPLLGILWLALAPIPATAEVFGIDHRQPLADEPVHRSLAANIGALTNSRSHTLCTAFCIGRDVIATAAHCLYGADTSIDETNFELNGTASPIAGHTAAVPLIASGTLSFSLRPPINATSDWALAKLAQPICKAGGLSLSQSTASDLVSDTKNDTLFQAGYHIDNADGQLLISTHCKVPARLSRVDRPTIELDFAAASSLILHTCDTGAGSSGSPIMINGPTGIEVVGINVGTYVRERASVERTLLPPRYRTDVIANTGVSATEFAKHIGELEHLKLIATRQELRELQSALAAEGWFSGPRDGRWSAELRAAIELYERIDERPIRGRPDMATLEALRARRTGRNVETGSVGNRLR